MVSDPTNSAPTPQILPEPGAEEVWMAILPKGEQARLRKLDVAADFKLQVRSISTHW
jgi:hypothetical protein